jgi:hypothetical protein
MVISLDIYTWLASSSHLLVAVQEHSSVILTKRVRFLATVTERADLSGCS